MDLNVITQMLASAGSSTGGPTGYQIERSLRFNSADTTYLSRTPASAGNRKTFTFSFWIKRTALGARQDLFVNTDVGGYSGQYFEFFSDDALMIGDYDVSGGVGWIWQVKTTALYRDVSAWYHIVVAVDTTQATSSNRVKIYINGSQVTALSISNYPNQNADLFWNSTAAARFGTALYGSQQQNAYVAEINFIDGQALTSSDFGEIDEITGVWKPKAFSGTYGTNGFYLKFADNSGTTATTLGKDSSGNGNNWTPNNFSVTAGAGNDSLVDTPTPYGTDTGVGGEVGGNYCTLNPTLPGVSSYISNGNLQFVNTYQFLGTMRLPTSGKWYAECTMTTVGGTSGGIIIGLATVYNSGASKLGIRAGANTTYNDFSATVDSSTHSALANNDVVGLAYDADNGTFDVYINNTIAAEFSNVPATVSNSQYTFACFGDYASDAGFWNFGQRPFAYTAPSGFKALCTQNLPAPTVVQGDNYFNTILWTGDATTPRTITGVGFQPDFVWAKSRNSASSHALYDVIRGAGSGKILLTDFNHAEGGVSSLTSDAEYGYLSAFTSDGFTTTKGSDSINYFFNNNGKTYVAWNWKANGAGITNNDGSTTSTVSVNQTAGFSLVTWTGNGSATTVGHGLGSTPYFIITKFRSATSGWSVYHVSTGALGRLTLNETNGFSLNSGSWNDTAPTSTVFSKGAGENDNGVTQIGYCFAPVAGFSAFGSYTGNGSTDGPFIYTGFRPAFVVVKGAGTVDGGNGDWRMQDSVRTSYNAIDKTLYSNLSNVEDTYTTMDFLSNGFKLRTTSVGHNQSGIQFIYMAFAENPFKYALAR